MEKSENEYAQAIKVGRAFVYLMNKAVNPLWVFPGGFQPTVDIYNALNYLGARYFPNGLSDERIIDCIIYQIYRYRESRHPVDYRWCFSRTAIDKFYMQFYGGGKGRQMTYYINQWLKEHNITRPDLIKLIARPKENSYAKYIYIQAEEMCKSRFLNTNVGFLMCKNNTTGWTPLSKNCKQCKFVSKCITESEKKYPEIIRLRKEYQNGNNN